MSTNRQLYQLNSGVNSGLRSILLTATEDYLHLPSNSRLTVPQCDAIHPTTNGAVFVDRDGVLIEDVGYLSSPDQIRVLPGVGSALSALQGRFSIIVVTNQSGVARGLFTEEDLLAVHSSLIQQLAEQGAIVDAFYYCPHLPEANVLNYRVECDCRKPSPGMLLRAERDWEIDLQRSYMVGDNQSDVEAGRSAGVRSVLVSDGRGGSEGDENWAPDLARAAAQILRHEAAS